jgi:phosphoglycerate dehydrogenase-like enzyme
MEILVSAEAAPRVATRLPRADRLLCMGRDGTIRAGSDPVPAREARAEVAWLTPDVLLDVGYGRLFFDFVLGTDTVRWVQAAAAGTDNPVFDQLLARGTRLSNAHVNAIPIAEYVLSSVLDHFQGGDRRRASQRDHVWRQEQYREVYATTWLVIGVGNIGSEVATRARAFGATVLGVRRTPTGTEPVDEMLTLDEMADHVARADVIVLAVPGTPGTRHLVDRTFLERVGADTVLVNVARGSVVDEAALLASLDQGRPGLAVLDTVAQEPLPPESPLWTHERVRITCHTAALGTGRLARGTDLFLENLRRYRVGATLVNELAATDLSATHRSGTHRSGPDRSGTQAGRPGRGA